MRWFVFVALTLAAVSMAQQAAAPPAEEVKTARLEGSVRNTTGEPVPRATLRLQAPVAGQLPVVHTIASDDQGNFVFENIDPGRNFRLSAQKPGFVAAQYGARRPNTAGAPLTLAAGQVMKGIVVEMTPQGVITGRITDRNGDPVQGALVMALRPIYARGERQYAPNGTAASNDQGEYRIANLAPGRYYLNVGQRVPGGVQRAAGEVQESNLTTYYANAPDLRSAVPIDITPGSELRGMDIRLLRGKTHTIRGRVVDAATGAAAVGVTMSAAQKEESNTLAAALLGRAAQPARPPDGSFEFNGLTPGAWVVQALPGRSIVNGQPAPPLLARREVTIADADVTDLVLEATPGATITGVVRVEGGDLRSALPAASADRPAAPAGPVVVAGGAAILSTAIQPSVVLSDMATPPLNTARPGVIQEDGSFVLEGVGSSRFRVNVTALPDGVYLKSVSFGGKQAEGGLIDLTAGAGGTLDIVLSATAADITGIARDSEGDALAGVFVTLWPQTPLAGDPGGGVRTAITDQNGGFQLRGIPPDEYYLAAWEDGDPGLLTSLEFRSKFTGQAPKVELGESAHQALEAVVIPADRIAEEADKLP